MITTPTPAWMDSDLAMLADLRNLRSLDYPVLSVAVRRLAQLSAVRAG